VKLSSSSNNSNFFPLFLHLHYDGLLPELGLPEPLPPLAGLPEPPDGDPPEDGDDDGGDDDGGADDGGADDGGAHELFPLDLAPLDFPPFEPLLPFPFPFPPLLLSDFPSFPFDAFFPMNQSNKSATND